MSRLGLVAALAVTLLTTNAALAGPERAPGVGPLTGNVLLLPVRVEVYEVAPAGVALLKADWTPELPRIRGDGAGGHARRQPGDDR